MRGKVAKAIRKTVYGDYAHNMHNDNHPNPFVRKRNREMGLRLRRQYQAAKREHTRAR